MARVCVCVCESEKRGRQGEAGRGGALWRDGCAQKPQPWTATTCMRGARRMPRHHGKHGAALSARAHLQRWRESVVSVIIAARSSSLPTIVVWLDAQPQAPALWRMRRRSTPRLHGARRARTALAHLWRTSVSAELAQRAGHAWRLSKSCRPPQPATCAALPAAAVQLRTRARRAARRCVALHRRALGRCHTPQARPFTRRVPRAARAPLCSRSAARRVPGCAWVPA
jgi:hypothetical protein